MKVDYSVEFPPGPMGLELEPLIKSAERELGCRVKDFFYAVGHNGIDQQVLESKVSVGDVISYVNGEDVRSYPFEQIVELLKSMKDQKKTIWFKNITASCQWKTLLFSLPHLSSHGVNCVLLPVCICVWIQGSMKNVEAKAKVANVRINKLVLRLDRIH